LKPDEVAFRCNLVTISKDHDAFVMDDYSAGHIGTEEARNIIEDIDKALGNDQVRFYPGVSYRHLMVWKGGTQEVDTTPPHDITGEPVGDYLDRLSGQAVLLDLMEKARVILEDHPVNVARIKTGKKPASHVWFWGQGHAPRLDAFEKKTGLKGAMISAVDLLNGIGVYTGFKIIRVPGATGYFDTDYEAKARYALEALEERDFVYVHVEAPDEAGHAGLLKEKIAAIEAFDTRVVGNIMEGLKVFSENRILVVTDHNTPLALRTHTREPVPFAMEGAGIPGPTVESNGFNEVSASKRSLHVSQGHQLLERFLRSSK
jgi:2,3-bisphosphoglycerate-independent phosphoglycerate mutase